MFSPIGSNFVKMMLKVEAERPLLRVVNDQIGNPTPSLDLAAAMLKIAPGLQREPGGLYHLTGAGSISWHDFAAFVFEQSRKPGGPAPALEAISSDEYRTAARQPMNSRLHCTAFSDRFGISLRPWKEAASATMARCLAD